MSSSNKNSDIQYKAAPQGMVNLDEAQGIVECFVAGIGNKDSVGDVCAPGAFGKSLTRRKPRVVWGHNWNDPIGKVIDMYEVPPNDPRLPAKMKAAGIGGLYARVQFNLMSEKGREAFASVAFFGEEQEWSIGYKTINAKFDPQMQANILYEVELYEVSPVLHGANQLTGTISVKSEEQPYGVSVIETPSIDGLNVNELSSILDALKAIASSVPEDEKCGPGMPQMMPTNSPGMPSINKPMSNPSPGAAPREVVKPQVPSMPENPMTVAIRRELATRTGSNIIVRSASDSVVIFDRIMADGTSSTYRLPFHYAGGEFMFGKPEKVQSQSSYAQGSPSSEQVIEALIAGGSLGSGKSLISFDDNEWGEGFSQNTSAPQVDAFTLNSVIANLQKIIEQKSEYIFEVAPEHAFEVKQAIDPILDFYKVDATVNENGIVVKSLNQDFLNALDVATKGVLRSIGNMVDRAVDRPRIGGNRNNRGQNLASRGPGIGSRGAVVKLRDGSTWDPKNAPDRNRNGIVGEGLFDSSGRSLAQPDPTPEGPDSVRGTNVPKAPQAPKAPAPAIAKRNAPIEKPSKPNLPEKEQRRLSSGADDYFKKITKEKGPVEWADLSEDDQIEFAYQLEDEYIYDRGFGDDAGVDALESGVYADAIQEYAEDWYNAELEKVKASKTTPPRGQLEPEQEKSRKETLGFLYEIGTDKDEAERILDFWEENDADRDKYLKENGAGSKNYWENVASAASAMYEDYISDAGDRQADRRADGGRLSSGSIDFDKKGASGLREMRHVERNPLRFDTQEEKDARAAYEELVANFRKNNGFFREVPMYAGDKKWHSEEWFRGREMAENVATLRFGDPIDQMPFFDKPGKPSKREFFERTTTVDYKSWYMTKVPSMTQELDRVLASDNYSDEYKEAFLDGMRTFFYVNRPNLQYAPTETQARYEEWLQRSGLGWKGRYDKSGPKLEDMDTNRFSSGAKDKKIIESYDHPEDLKSAMFEVMWTNGSREEINNMTAEDIAEALSVNKNWVEPLLEDAKKYTIDSMDDYEKYMSSLPEVTDEEMNQYYLDSLSRNAGRDYAEGMTVRDRFKNMTDEEAADYAAWMDEETWRDRDDRFSSGGGKTPEERVEAYDRRSAEKNAILENMSPEELEEYAREWNESHVEDVRFSSGSTNRPRSTKTGEEFAGRGYGVHDFFVYDQEDDFENIDKAIVDSLLKNDRMSVDEMLSEVDGLKDPDLSGEALVRRSDYMGSNARRVAEAVANNTSVNPSLANQKAGREDILHFRYKDKQRSIYPETFSTSKKGVAYFVGWDETADNGNGAYRSFNVDQIQGLISSAIPPYADRAARSTPDSWNINDFSDEDNQKILKAMQGTKEYVELTEAQDFIDDEVRSGGTRVAGSTLDTAEKEAQKAFQDARNKQIDKMVADGKVKPLSRETRFASGKSEKFDIDNARSFEQMSDGEKFDVVEGIKANLSETNPTALETFEDGGIDVDEYIQENPRLHPDFSSGGPEEFDVLNARSFDELSSKEQSDLIDGILEKLGDTNPRLLAEFEDGGYSPDEFLQENPNWHPDFSSGASRFSSGGMPTPQEQKELLEFARSRSGNKFMDSVLGQYEERKRLSEAQWAAIRRIRGGDSGGAKATTAVKAPKSGEPSVPFSGKRRQIVDIEDIEKYDYPELKDYKPTPEQDRAIDAMMTGADVKVGALAATGKTTTVINFANRLKNQDPSARVAYVVFNANAKDDVKKRGIPGNVDVSTMDGIAYNAMDAINPEMTKKSFSKRQGHIKPIISFKDRAKYLGVKGMTSQGEDYTDVDVYKMVAKAVDAYSISDDAKIGPQHFTGAYNGGLKVTDESMLPQLLKYANKMWEDMNLPRVNGATRKDQQGMLPINNTHLTKMWSFTNPDIGSVKGVNVVMVDEAQDMNPVFAGILRNSNSIQRIYIGDTNQAINAWRGADGTTLANAEATYDMPITDSFRFGKNVAGMGNRFLSLLGTKERMTGKKTDKSGSPVDGKIGQVENPTMILTRSNGGAIAATLEVFKDGGIVYGSANFKNDLQNFLNNIEWMQNKDRGKAFYTDVYGKSIFSAPEPSQDLDGITNIVEFNKAIEKADNNRLNMLKKLMDDNSVDDLKKALDNIITDKSKLPKNRDEYVHIQTAHTSKGLESPRVKIWTDFRKPKKLENGEWEYPNEQELRLSYVAVTRAEEELELGSLDWILGHTNEEDGLPNTLSSGRSKARGNRGDGKGRGKPWSDEDRQRFADRDVLRAQTRQGKRRQGPAANEFSSGRRLADGPPDSWDNPPSDPNEMVWEEASDMSLVEINDTFNGDIVSEFIGEMIGNELNAEDVTEDTPALMHIAENWSELVDMHADDIERRRALIKNIQSADSIAKQRLLDSIERDSKAIDALRSIEKLSPEERVQLFRDIEAGNATELISAEDLASIKESRFDINDLVNNDKFLDSLDDKSPLGRAVFSNFDTDTVAEMLIDKRSRYYGDDDRFSSGARFAPDGESSSRLQRRLSSGDVFGPPPGQSARYDRRKQVEATMGAFHSDPGQATVAHGTEGLLGKIPTGKNSHILNTSAAEKIIANPDEEYSADTGWPVDAGKLLDFIKIKNKEGITGKPKTLRELDDAFEISQILGIPQSDAQKMLDGKPVYIASSTAADMFDTISNSGEYTSSVGGLNDVARVWGYEGAPKWVRQSDIATPEFDLDENDRVNWSQVKWDGLSKAEFDAEVRSGKNPPEPVYTSPVEYFNGDAIASNPKWDARGGSFKNPTVDSEFTAKPQKVSRSEQLEQDRFTSQARAGEKNARADKEFMNSWIGGKHGIGAAELMDILGIERESEGAVVSTKDARKLLAEINKIKEESGSGLIPAIMKDNGSFKESLESEIKERAISDEVLHALVVSGRFKNMKEAVSSLGDPRLDSLAAEYDSRMLVDAAFIRIKDHLNKVGAADQKKIISKAITDSLGRKTTLESRVQEGRVSIKGAMNSDGMIGDDKISEVVDIVNGMLDARGLETIDKDALFPKDETGGFVNNLSSSVPGAARLASGQRFVARTASSRRVEAGADAAARRETDRPSFSSGSKAPSFRDENGRMNPTAMRDAAVSATIPENVIDKNTGGQNIEDFEKAVKTRAQIAEMFNITGPVKSGFSVYDLEDEIVKAGFSQEEAADLVDRLVEMDSYIDSIQEKFSEARDAIDESMEKIEDSLEKIDRLKKERAGILKKYGEEDGQVWLEAIDEKLAKAMNNVDDAYQSGVGNEKTRIGTLYSQMEDILEANPGWNTLYPKSQDISGRLIAIEASIAKAGGVKKAVPITGIDFGVPDGTRLSSGKADEYFQNLTSHLINLIEKSQKEGGKWEAPWHKAGNLPKNASTKNMYSGGNLFALMLAAEEKGYTTPNWAGFQQWKKLGGTVRKGEKATAILMPKPLLGEEIDPETGKKRKVSKGVYFVTGSVFNLDQIEGIDRDEFLKLPVDTMTPEQRVGKLEDAIAEVGATIMTGDGSRAYYSPREDHVVMPPFELFKSPEGYYGTLAHELVHWTGHTSRLDRNNMNQFGSPDYAREELVAEFGSAFLLAAFGLSAEPREDHAHYLANWLKVLRDEPNALQDASIKAQEAAKLLIEKMRAVLEDMGQAASDAESDIDVKSLNIFGDHLYEVKDGLVEWSKSIENAPYFIKSLTQYEEDFGNVNRRWERIAEAAIFLNNINKKN